MEGLGMWIVLGSIVIIATVLNIIMYATGKDFKMAMAFGLSFTAFILCAGISIISEWIRNEDWSALMDVVVSTENYGQLQYN